ncbi:MAG: PilN domain-containing protein [Desulfobulbaceae bacterium]|uniref:PilN domain-containing protein n=1 Tax=Candidatus Desulfatifera sulfidica TaxID=2841691 RepID=A0A8J6NBU5_9BACT|nr:PilN domain-containing protein [Candidatus Desulfatifera sulfidica]
MLRINLLPIEQLKEQANARNQLQIFFSALIVLLLTLLAIGLFQANKAKGLEQDIVAIKKELEHYKPILKQIKDIEKAKKELERKIQVIKTLDKESSLTVEVLDQVAQLVDSSRLWLTSLKQQGSSLALTGVALDNQTIAHFMNKLEASPHVGTVNLSNASLTRVAGRSLKSFSLQCSVALPPEQDAAENKQPGTP